MNQENPELSEGRTFFVILTLLVGIGVTMAIASIGILFMAALTF
jgi:hypothetical protein